MIIVHLIKPQSTVNILHGETWKKLIFKKLVKGNTWLEIASMALKHHFYILSIAIFIGILVLPTKGMEFISLHLNLERGQVICSNQQEKTKMMIRQFQAYVFEF